ncbi:Putative EH domain, EF-hand domain pair protein [Colletotrichum destructivum]|uniref:EH domain, EF-hand domain pair protein n=1 Tax=Colletotrichum destructivum TaxID=34406 RepID=A0AAX4HWF2_9PEZI|nr:Putative EH domain, EF-hand domain pair protein [Colletotrichum destructivum]
MTIHTHHHHHTHQPSAAGPGGASDAAAALKGANLAFNKTKTQPKPIPPPKPTTGRRRGASLVAVSTASNYDRSTSTSPVQRQHTGTTSLSTTPGDRDRFGRDGTTDMRDRLSNFLSSSPAAAAAHLSPHTRLDPKSPSYIAATLAASRSVSPTPQPHASPASLTPAQLNQLHQMQNARSAGARRARPGSAESSSVVSSLELPDTTSIPATGHLIHMFEKGGGADDLDPVKRSGGGVVRPQLRAPTPERELSPSRAKAARMGIVEEEASVVQKPVVTKPKPKPKAKPRPVTPALAAEGNPVEDKATPMARKPVPAAANPLLSPARVVHRRSESEQTAPSRKPHPSITMSPVAPEAPEVQSKSQLTRVPITQTTRPASRVPPATPEPRRARPKAQQTAAPSSPPVVKRAETEVVSPKPTRPASKAKLRPPTPPQPRGSVSKAKVSEAPPLTQPRSMASVYGRGPPKEPSRRPSSEARPSTADTSSSNDTFVSAESDLTAMPDDGPARPAPRPMRSAQSTPGRSSANSSPSRATPGRTPVSSSGTNMPLNSLSNAIMAGSLAASRLTPSNTGNSTLSPAPMLPGRTKSPRMRQTLRQPPSKSDDEDEMRKKKHQRASNKHSHREGARRRWRDEITLRERRRYEAVWASNRGILLVASPQSPEAPAAITAPPPDAADCVVNVVVREIWRRSRLPLEELAEVWEVVDRGRRGMLSKAEFVVGMWLIDQRLRGRKIPMKVSDSVWNSAQGVNVPPPKVKK